jgi:hypothetical protein
MSAPVFFSWLDQDGTLHDQSGTTRDVSMAGAFIVADTVPSLGATVGVDIYLPYDKTGRIVELHGEGKVSRVEGAGRTSSGFAAEVMFQTPSSSAEARLSLHEAQ